MKKVICVGRVDAEKRPEDAIEITRRVRQTIPDTELIWIGEGTLFKKCKKLEEKESFIHFVGQIGSPKSKERLKLLRSSDVLVSTSQREGFCVPIGEAFLAGLPVIAYDLPVYRSVYENTVIYIPCFRIDVFVKAVIDVLLNPDRYKPFIEKGCRLVREKYSVPNVAKRIEDALEMLLLT